MYHFVAESAMPIPYANCQYLKTFQVEAVKFLQSHYDQHTFCVLNDESGLGKSAVTAVFLNNMAKRCLIIVQNDDECIINWKFHLSLLTNLPVFVFDENTSSNRFNCYACVCLIKWNTMRCMNVEISDFNFDIVIVDNRGEMLNNAFCCANIVKQFERKINLVISSSDITSNVKLLHTILRLGDRLEHHHQNYKAFERKFNLPNIKDITHKKCNLEEYFAKREMISVYCRDFRLRRYKHQFEHMLPLVKTETYRNNLRHWQNEQDIDVNSIMIEDGQHCTVFETETEELLHNFYNEQLAINKTVMIRRQTRRSSRSDEDDRMSPLVFLSDSETDHNVYVITSPTEIIDLTTETEKLCPSDFSESQQGENLKEYSKSKKLTRAQRNNITTIPISNIASDSCKDDVRDKDGMSSTNGKVLKVRVHRCSRQSIKNNNAITLSTTKTVKHHVPQKKQHCDNGMDKCIDKRETRSMKRFTRSNHLKNIYMNIDLSLSDHKKQNHKSKHTKRNGKIKNRKKKSERDDCAINTTDLNVSKHTNKQIDNALLPEQCKSVSQLTIISPSDYNIDCAQRLSSESNLPTTERIFHGSWDEFAVPSIPSNYLMSTTAHTVENVTNDTISLSSSISDTSSVNDRVRIQSLQHRHNTSSISECIDKQTSHMDLLISTKLLSKNCAKARRVNKSPDLFSNCSDLEMICMQDRSMFNAFGVCGVEAKMMQQQSAKRQRAQRGNTNRVIYSKSCLDVLEKVFHTQRSEDVMSTPSILPQHPTKLTAALSQTSSKTGPHNINADTSQLLSQSNCNKITNYIKVTQHTPETTTIDTDTDIASTHCVSTPHKQKIKMVKTPRRNHRTPKSPKSPRTPKTATQSTKLTRWLPHAGRASGNKEIPRRRRLELV